MIFKRYFRYLKDKKIIFFVGVFCGIIAGVMSGFGLPVIFQTVFKNVFESHEKVWTALQIIGFSALVPMVFMIRGIFSFLNVNFMNKCGLSILNSLRKDLFAKIQELPMEFFDKNLSADLMNRVINDTKALQETIIEAASELFCQPIQALAALGGLIYLSYKNNDSLFLLIFLSAIPLCIVPIRMIKTRLKQKSRLVQESESEMAHDILENLSAIQEVRSFNLQNAYKTRLSIKMERFMNFVLQTIQYQKSQQPIMETLGAFIVGTVFLYAFYNKIPFSVFSSMAAALYFAFDPIKKTVNTISQIYRVHGSFLRIEQILNTNSSVKESSNPVSLKNCEGEISCESISFGYKDDIVLDNITLNIPKGKFYALVGQSGAGKSTFMKLIPRFYDLKSGSLKLDGIDVRDISLSDLRSQIGIVPQNTVLFNDSVYNNILVGNPNATKEEVVQAAKNAFAHDFILNELSSGYETNVGERGNSLSGGQRQRIAIARAFLKNAPILLLDEATAALDSQSEHFVQLALKSLSKNKTVLAIAHRLSTIKHADCILVFEKGKIIAQGTHDFLIENNSIYAEFVNKQTLS